MSLNFQDLAKNDLRGSYSYRNVTGLTFATVGAGTISVRNDPNQSLFLLNRERGNMQRLMSSELVDLRIPGINLGKVVQGIRDAGDLYRAVTADVPQSVRNEGQAGINQYQRLILQGATEAEARLLIQSPQFRAALIERRSYDALRAGNATQDDIERSYTAIIRGEEIFRDPATGELKVRTLCNDAGPCDRKVSELQKANPADVKAWIAAKMQEAIAAGNNPELMRSAIECAVAMAFAKDGDMTYFDSIRAGLVQDQAQLASLNRLAQTTASLVSNARLSGVVNLAAGRDVSLSMALVEFEQAVRGNDRAGMTLAAQKLALINFATPGSAYVQSGLLMQHYANAGQPGAAEAYRQASAELGNLAIDKRQQFYEALNAVNPRERLQMMADAGIITDTLVNMAMGAGGGALATRFISNTRVIDYRTGKAFYGTVDLQPTIDRISTGVRVNHRNDGTEFYNRVPSGFSQPPLPIQNAGYYTEWVVPSIGMAHVGPQRLIVGRSGEMYYTPDHYKTFVRIK